MDKVKNGPRKSLRSLRIPNPPTFWTYQDHIWGIFLCGLQGAFASLEPLEPLQRHWKRRKCRKSSTSFDGKCRAGQSIFNDWCQYDVNLMSPDLHQVLHPPLSGSAKSEYRRERPADPGRCRSARVGSGWSSSDDHRGLGRVAPIRSIALWKCLEGLLPGDTHHPPIGWAWTSNPNQNTAHSHLLHSFIACCAKLLGPIFNSHKK